MPAKLELFLSGQFLLKLDGRPVETLVSNKAKALLIYLAITQKAHSRSTLAALLWGDMPEASARANLRMALTALRKSIGDNLQADRHSVSLDNDGGLWVDVLVLEKSCRPQNFSLTAVKDLREAITLYKGDFLGDYYVPDAPLFEEWVTLTRERFRQTASDCLDFLVTWAIENHALADGISDARQLLALDPWREESHRHLMILLAQNGQRSAALNQYEICSCILAEELGVEPALETQQLCEKIRTGEVGSPNLNQQASLDIPSPPSEIPHNIPAQTTTFVGREREIDQIADLFTDPGCRLLTIVGPGGMGKTRLSLQVGRQLIENFADGVFFIQLAALTSEIQFIAAIAESTGFTFSGPVDAKTQLLRAIQKKTLLLVLDNFEQLAADGTELLVEILETAPKIKIIITSRESLNLYEEWIFELQGLEIPPTENVSDFENYNAVQLFVRRASRAHLGFSLEQERAAITQICHLVEGMPLGIELAAAWVRTLSCADIAGEIQKNLEFLSSGLRNIPERHRSLGATFEYSWNLLKENEREVLAKFSVFRGGCTAKAALDLTGATLRDLSALVDKSLIMRTPASRYSMHELLRQFAQEKLQAEELEKIKVLHANYYGNFLYQRAATIEGADEKKIIAEINHEIDNLRAGWNLLVDLIHSHFPNIENYFRNYIPTLAHFYRQQCWYEEGRQAYNKTSLAMVSANWGNHDNTQKEVLATVWSRLAEFHFLLGNYDEAEKFFEHSVPILKQHVNQKEAANALLRWGSADLRKGNLLQADTHIQESLHIFKELNHKIGIADALNALGVSAYHQGGIIEAESYYKQCMEISKMVGFYRGEVNSLNNLGSLYIYQDQYEKALELHRNVLELAEVYGDRRTVAMALTSIGSSTRELGHYSEALQLFEKSLLLFREIGHKRWISACLDGLGRTYLQMEDLDAARTHLYEALMIAQEIHSQPDIISALYSLAVLASMVDRTSDATTITIFVVHHPACKALAHKRAKLLFSELATKLSKERLDSAQKVGETLTLEQAIALAKEI